MKHWNLSRPIVVHVEVTDGCNEKCWHCYNFNREDNKTVNIISKLDLDNTIKELIDSKVFHVIITGGEPLLVMNRVIYLAEQCTKAGISISLNSNMLAADDAYIGKLLDAGIDHVLTTIHSHKPETHDYITNVHGSHKRTCDNIIRAQSHGLRVTVNTILCELNKNDIYRIGRYVNSLGVRKFLANRVIPSPSNENSSIVMDRKYVLKMFDDLLRLKEDFRMEVGTCRNVPACMFDDQEKYKDFIGRGCAAGKRHIVLDIKGNARACVSEEATYGNIHKIGIRGVWYKMGSWRIDSYIPNACKNCHMLDICHAGCRMVAMFHTKHISGVDNLRRGFKQRQENGFRIVKVGKGAKTIFVDDK